MILHHVCFRNITESQIDDIFSKYGNIVQKNILKDKLTGLPRGVAFVRYVSFTFVASHSQNHLVLSSSLAKMYYKETVPFSIKRQIVVLMKNISSYSLAHCHSCHN